MIVCKVFWSEELGWVVNFFYVKDNKEILVRGKRIDI